MLNMEQYQVLVGLIPAISSELRKKGVALDGDEEDEGVKDEDDEEEEAPAKASRKSKKQFKKANIEATSDEDES